MSQLLKNMSLALVVAAMLATPVLAQETNVDYLGYAYETGGFPTSDAGDELVLLAVATYAADIFEVDLGLNELTFHVYGFISEGQVDIGGGNLQITYTGGYVDVWRDTRMDADYGTYPPNGTAPSTFNNGVLFFRGANDGFTLTITPTGYGYFEGDLLCMAGEIIDGPCGDCAYTWGGAFDLNTGAQIPDGYDLQIDGALFFDPSVPTENSSWSGVKALYR